MLSMDSQMDSLGDDMEAADSRTFDTDTEGRTWEYDGPLAPSGALAMRFQGRWVDAETGNVIDAPRWKRREVGPWEWFVQA